MLMFLKKLVREEDANEILRQCEGLDGFEFVDHRSGRSGLAIGEG